MSFSPCCVLPGGLQGGAGAVTAGEQLRWQVLSLCRPAAPARAQWAPCLLRPHPGRRICSVQPPFSWHPLPGAGGHIACPCGLTRRSVALLTRGRKELASWCGLSPAPGFQGRSWEQDNRLTLSLKKGSGGASGGFWVPQAAP